MKRIISMHLADLAYFANKFIEMHNPYLRPLLLLLFISATIACNKAQETAKTPSATNVAYHLEKVVDQVEIPWGMAFLPDGAILYTEKAGNLIHFKGGEKRVIGGLPAVFDKGQGGLLDVVLHPKYEANGWIYLSLSVSDDGKKGNTQIMRGKLKDYTLVEQEVLYRAKPDTNKPYHFGCRMGFAPDGFLYFSIGERGERDVNPQDITRDGGKIYRLHDDGKIPADNPFVNDPSAKPAIYCYGNRNPQGLAIHPETGAVWTHEHGPRGGDEINIIRSGINYGWPVITYGINYGGTKITEETAREGMEQPLHYWVPSIAPSGMAFVDSDKYPDWQGSLLVGSLKFMYLHRCILEGEKVVREEKLFEKAGRIRDVRQAPDGFIYVSIENEGIFKIVK